MAGKGEFKFRQVTILKETLGNGAYGVVYKAKCDELICAAKYMHPIFFAISDDPEVKDNVTGKFKRECQLLGRLKHPNIVQYLGIHEIEGIDTVVLLMELMDTSLYAYLQNHAHAPLPFHQEVNISHDVARALDYLHVNGIHHRDLSAKNILMLGDLRAKVSDFGQSKLRDPTSGYSSNSPCPGNILYMPPETLKVPPDFTPTLDEFSFGVVTIQLMNRKEPQPSELHRQGSLPGTLVEVPEIERRKADIDSCDAGNPILQISISCISNNPNERPPIEKVCQLLSLLKGTTQYKKSDMGLSNGEGKENVCPIEDYGEILIIELNQNDTHYTSRIDDLTSTIKGKDTLLKDQSNLLDIRNKQLLQKNNMIEKYEKELKVKESEECKEKSQLQEHNQRLETKVSELRDLLSRKEEEIAEKEKQLIEKEEQLRRKEEAIIAQQVSSDERYSICVSELEQLKGESERLQVELSLRAPDSPFSLESPPRSLSPSHQNNLITSAQTRVPRKPKQLDLKWQARKQTPVAFQPQSSIAVSCKDKVYVTYCNYSRSEGKIYEYSLSSDTWSQLPLLRKSEFSLAVIDDEYIVAVGGSAALRKSGSVLQYFSANSKWIKAFPDMPTPRSFPSCVTVGNYLVVAGGEVNGEPVPVVEILDIARIMWHFVLPFPTRSISRMTVSTDESFAYFLGGFEEGSLSKLAYAVNVSRLVAETERREGKRLWLELSSLPVSGATCASFRKRILALGGYNTVTKSSSDLIYEFDQIEGSWKPTGHLPRPFTRGLVTVATYEGRKLLVVIGGNMTNGISTATSVAYL